MDAVDLVELKPELIRRQQFGRNDADYSLMLAICHILLRRQMPTETPGENNQPTLDRDALTLHEIYEQFIATFYKAHLSADWDVSSQLRIHWPTEKESLYVPAMFLDLQMQHKQSRRLVVLDTKFTASVLVPGRWYNVIFDPSHLFQMYGYLRSQEHWSESHQSATGILLYPTVEHRVSEMVRIQGHDIRWETIDLNQPWENIESDLLEIPSVALPI